MNNLLKKLCEMDLIVRVLHLMRKDGRIMNKLDKIDEIVKVVKAQEELGLAKAKSIIEDVKNYEMPEVPIPDFLKKEEVVVEVKQKKKCNVCLIITIVLAIVAVAAVVYGLYCYFTPDYLDDFEDDFEDDEFDDDDFFEDEDKKEEKATEEKSE